MIVYHGTRTIPDRFDLSLIGRGAEPNSALGVWATRDPHLAYDYAGGRHIAVLSTATPKLASAHDYQTLIWGGPEYGPAQRRCAFEMFKKARLSLMAQGYDGIWCECPGLDLDSAVCLFRPETIDIQRVIRHAEDADIDPLEDPLDDSFVDFQKRLEDELELARLSLKEVR